MDKKNITTFLIEIDTVYGSIGRKGWFDIKETINNKQLLEQHIDYILGVVKTQILKEFENKEKEATNETRT